ncbi:unnamed protein product [Ilex paraguariensis]|uniref:Uncharacterized protein n=1 Tax=Ilex paraguariensis TaxID=185542 RepID=A0ABC8SCP2_9AQUA
MDSDEMINGDVFLAVTSGFSKMYGGELCSDCGGNDYEQGKIKARIFRTPGVTFWNLSKGYANLQGLTGSETNGPV